MRLELHNDAAADARILKWNTPWDPASSVFRIASQGSAVRYQGITVIRANKPPPAEDYLSIAPGGQLSLDYALDAHYALEHGRTYDISLRSPIVASLRDGSDRRIEVSCGSGTLHPEAREGVGELEQPLHAQASGCNAQQETEINLLDRHAKGAARAAKLLTYGGSKLYDEWFGRWSTSNLNTVRGRIDRYLTKDWEVRCGGGSCLDHPTAFGVVHHSLSDDKLYVCPAWWNLPGVSTETFSRVGVLIHEHTHLEPDGTEDINDISSCGANADLEGLPCYGAVNARNLANDPTCQSSNVSDCKAVRNAENYAFFVTDALTQNIVATQ